MSREEFATSDGDISRLPILSRTVFTCSPRATSNFAAASFDTKTHTTNLRHLLYLDSKLPEKKTSSALISSSLKRKTVSASLSVLSGDSLTDWVDDRRRRDGRKTVQFVWSATNSGAATAANVRPPLPLPRLHRLLPHLRRGRVKEWSVRRKPCDDTKKRFEGLCDIHDKATD